MPKYLIGTFVAIFAAGFVATMDQRSSLDRMPSPVGGGSSIAAQLIFASGTVEGASEDIELRAEQFGRIREVKVTSGQWVAPGDVLVCLDDAAAQQETALAAAKLELARAELERLTNGARAEERDEAGALVRVAQARLDQAVRNLARLRRLQNDHAVAAQEADDQQSLVDTSRAELEAAQARAKQVTAAARVDDLHAAHARVTAAEAELELAKVHLAKYELLAPRRARVLDTHSRIGELTSPQASEPLVVLSDTSVLHVRAYVEELDAPRIQVGMRASVTADGLPHKSFTGKVVSTSPRMAHKSIRSDHPNELYDTKMREVLVALADADELIAGLRVDVKFEMGSSVHAESATKAIPQGAPRE